tara:strand:- start:2 stop:718 length:717 start_codon:yes stop_codon:yes gene_type:complete
MCRSDIVFALQRVARNMHKCTDATVNAGKRILAYLKGTRSTGLEYSPELESNFKNVYGDVAKKGGHELPDLVAFTDSDFAGCSVTLRSTSGSILYYRGTPIVWSSKRQTVRAASTCEAEYVALYDVIRLSQNQGFLDWFLHEKELPLIFSDNKSALDLAKSSVVTKRSKHMNLRYHLVRDHFKDLCYCPTDINKADPLTKPLVSSKYISLFKTADVSGSPDSSGYYKSHYVTIDSLVQ